MRLLVSLLAVSFTLAGTVSHTLTIAPGDVVRSETDEFTIIGLELAREGMVRSWTSVPGEPLLPVISGNILIPAGAELLGLTVTPLERVELGMFRLHPVQPMRPLSKFDELPFVGPDPAVYLSDAVFPAEPLTVVPAGNKSGYRIAGFLYCPFEYRPASGRLTLITRAEVRAEYREHALPVNALTPAQDELFGRDVAELVVNPQDRARMAPPIAALDAGDEIDVVMFTSATLAPELAGLRQWLARKGYFAEIVRHDTLSNPGRDVQERMRNLIKDLFAERGLKYVILAGNYQHCPVRYGYLPYTTFDIPADMYFGDLDGCWDANNNNRFGEMDGDSVDLFHDVYVGRLPLSNAAQAANLLRKDTIYEKIPDPAYLNNVLLGHEWLWQNINYHGGIVNHNIALLLNERSPWEVDSQMNMSPTRATNGLNAGRHHFHFAGHGSQTAFGSTFSTSHLPGLTNIDKPVIVTSIACHSGWFDRAQSCLGEMFVNATNGGAVATFLNARFGWGAPPCQGPNENLDCQIIHNFQKAMTMGQAHGLAKDFLRNESFSQLSTRWALYVNTLQGDPTLRAWRGAPETAVVNHADTIAAMAQSFPVEVETPRHAVLRELDGRPVAQARCAITHRGELLSRAVTDNQGRAWLQVPAGAFPDTATLYLSVTGPDIAYSKRRLHTTGGTGAALPVYYRAVVNTPQGRLNPGDTAEVHFILANRGDLAADSTRALLTALSDEVTVLDSWSRYGDIAVGDTARGEAFRIAVRPDCPHARRVEFRLEAESPQGRGVSHAALTVGLPHGRGGNWGTLDTGDYVLAVMNNGGIGSTEWRGEGFGFIYPKTRRWSNSALMHGSLILGTDTSWVADNYYGAPDWRNCGLEFEPIDSVRPVWPPELGDKQLIAHFSDANHPEPRGIYIDHRAYGSARPTHQDFVILEYRLHNTGPDRLDNLYVGVACDFRTGDWNQNDVLDYAGTDSVRTIAWNRNQPETTALGIRPIYPPSMAGWANCIFHNTWINDGFTKAEKMGFLDGSLRSTTGTTQGRWHAMVSSGPYTIPANDSQIVAFALVGGRSVNAMLASSDTAALWYNPPVGLAGDQARPERQPRFTIGPRLFADGLRINYRLETVEPVQLAAFDASGRRRAEHRFTPETASGSFLWRPQLAPGVYFVRVGDETEKLLKLR